MLNYKSIYNNILLINSKIIFNLLMNCIGKKVLNEERFFGGIKVILY